MENKESYTKYLLKEKLSLLFVTSRVEEAIRQSEDIVKINAINLIFVKEQLFSFMKKKSEKIIETFSMI